MTTATASTTSVPPAHSFLNASTSLHFVLAAHNATSPAEPLHALQGLVALSMVTDDVSSYYPPPHASSEIQGDVTQLLIKAQSFSRYG